MFCLFCLQLLYTRLKLCVYVYTYVYPHVQQEKAYRHLLKLIMSVLNYSVAGSGLCLPLCYLLLVEEYKFDNLLQLEHSKMWTWHSPELHCSIHQFRLVLHKQSLFPRISFFQELGNRDNVVRVSNSGTSSRFSLPWNRPDRLWSPHTLQLNGYRCYLQGVRRPGREANRSPLPSAEVKNEWSCTSAPPICLHGAEKDNVLFHKPTLVWIFHYTSVIIAVFVR